MIFVFCFVLLVGSASTGIRWSVVVNEASVVKQLQFMFCDPTAGKRGYIIATNPRYSGQCTIIQRKKLLGKKWIFFMIMIWFLTKYPVSGFTLGIPIGLDYERIFSVPQLYGNRFKDEPFQQTTPQREHFLVCKKVTSHNATLYHLEG